MEMMITLLKELILLNKLFFPNKWLTLQKLQKKFLKFKTKKHKILGNTAKNHMQHNQIQDRMLLIQSKAFKQAINFIGKTFDDMDKKKNRKIIK